MDTWNRNNILEFKIGDFSTRVVFSGKDELLLPPQDVKCLTVFDRNTSALFESQPQPSHVLPPGEENKTMESVEDILSAAIENGLARDGLFIGVGGGVVCDMTAFASSIYMRGCRVILIPTTLLAMVDASLGGKTGVDFRGYKNMAGSFFPAEELRICPEILLSLPEREYRSGLAELIKHAFLVKSDLLRTLKEQREGILNRDGKLLGAIIAESIKIKGRFVEEDFREQGIRAYLNFGHTFGHALESVSGFSGWSHGEAVAWGMDKALKAGVLMGETDINYAAEVSEMLSLYGFRLEAPEADVDALIAATAKDKKKRSGKVRFVLQQSHGETFQAEIPDEILRKVL